MLRKCGILLALTGMVFSACTAATDPGTANTAPVGGGMDASSVDDGGADGAQEDASMVGTLYEPGRKFGQTYCSPCHSKGGQHPKQSVAYPGYQVDTYETFSFSKTILLAVLDKWNPDGPVMPPPEAYVDPPDDERRLMLDWVRRGMPNTVDGN